MEELLIIERKMIAAKYEGKKIKYWWYKHKYKKRKEKREKQNFTKNKK